MDRTLALKEKNNEKAIENNNSKPSVSWKEIKSRMLKNPEVAAAIKEIEPEYEIIQQIIKLRIEQDISQKELAARAGTKQSNISRLESGDYNPSMQFLKKVAKALGKELHVSFK